MFARCTTMHFKIAFIDQAIKIYTESVVPAAESQKGFQGIHLFLDRKTGKAVSIALWETEKEAIANEESHYYQEQLVKLMNLFAQPPVREGFEVIV